MCVHKSKSDEYIIICLYVDDMLFFGTRNDIICRKKNMFLGSKFEIERHE